MMSGDDEPVSVGTWAKRYYYANRLAVETILRSHGVGPTQWLVLRQLATHGPTAQRDLGRIIDAERAALSGIVATLVRKGLVEQVTSTVDQRQRQLDLSAAGRELWAALPDPFSRVREVALAGIGADDIEAAIRVLERATQQVQAHAFE
jgi:DNA-binding MarR family transcriptional regulator